MRTDVILTGDREALAAMEAMGDATSVPHLIAAQAAAVQPVIDGAKGRAPSRRIAEGIQIVKAEVRGGQVKTEVGLPGGRKPWFHGLFYELGTGPRIQKKSGRRTGSMPANPFLRPAFDAERGNVRRLFFDYLRNVIMGARRG